MNAIILFTKVPLENFSKTRLMPHLSPLECRELQEILLKNTVSEFQKFDKIHNRLRKDVEIEKSNNIYDKKISYGLVPVNNLSNDILSETDFYDSKKLIENSKFDFSQKNIENAGISGVTEHKPYLEESSGKTDLFVFYTPEKEIYKLKSLLPDINVEYFVQEGEDIFEKMENAFDKVFKKGYKKVILTGSDIFDLNIEDLFQAFHKLDKNDIVIGETFDGGYYLIGMKKIKEGILKVNTDRVFSESIENFKLNNLSYGILDKKQDIDEIDDLKKVYRILEKRGEKDALKLFLDRIKLIEK